MESDIFNYAIEMSWGVSFYEVLSEALTIVMVRNGRESVSSDIVSQRWNYPLKRYYNIPNWETLKNDLELASKAFLETVLKNLKFDVKEEDERVLRFARNGMLNVADETYLILNQQVTALGFPKGSKDYHLYCDNNFNKAQEEAKERAVLKARWTINALERQQAAALNSQKVRGWVYCIHHYQELVKDLKAIGVDAKIIESYCSIIEEYKNHLDSIEKRYANHIGFLEKYIADVGL